MILCISEILYTGTLLEAIFTVLGLVVEEELASACVTLASKQATKASGVDPSGGAAAARVWQSTTRIYISEAEQRTNHRSALPAVQLCSSRRFWLLQAAGPTQAQ